VRLLLPGSRRVGDADDPLFRMGRQLCDSSRLQPARELAVHRRIPGGIKKGRVRQLTQRIWARTGRRGTFLLITGTADILVGTYLLATGLPPAPYDLAIRQAIWGGIWIAVGVLLFTGAFTRRDRWQFATAVFLKMAWALEFARLAIDDGGWLWLVTAAWIMVAAAVLLVSSWPEPDRT